MYVFVTLEKVVAFFAKLGITLDISLLSTYELSIILLLSNILVLLFYIFFFYVLYKLIFRILDWWF